MFLVQDLDIIRNYGYNVSFNTLYVLGSSIAYGFYTLVIVVSIHYMFLVQLEEDWLEEINKCFNTLYVLGSMCIIS